VCLIVLFDLYSAKCVGIPLLENLFSQILPIMLAFCSLLSQTYYSKNYASTIGTSLVKKAEILQVSESLSQGGTN